MDKELNQSSSSGSQNGKAPQKHLPSPSAFSIDSLDASKSLANTVSCLEFLLVSFCQHFSLKPKQAAGLLTQDGKYLSYVISKGLKGKHEPIISWYQAIYDSYQPLLSCLLKEEASGSIPLILSTLHFGFTSKSLETVLWTCRLFSKLGKEFQDQGLLPAAWDVSHIQWFAEFGIEACLSACGRFGPDVKGQVVSVFVEFAHNNFLELFTIQLRNRLTPSTSYMTTMSEFLPVICEMRYAKQELVAQGIIDFWLDLALKESDQRRSSDLRSASLSFLCDIWTRFPAKIESQEELANQILTALKRAARDTKSHLMQVSIRQLGTVAKMFGLLDHFSTERNDYAPIIYKTLTFALVENYGMDEIREFLLENFISTFQSTPEMPIGILLDPYLKQLQVSDISLCNLPDYHFFSIVSKHPRLGLKNAVQLLDVLGKCCIATPIYTHAIDQPFQTISERFVQVQVMQEFLYQFMNRLLLSFLQSETGQSDFPDSPHLSIVCSHFITRIVSLQNAQLRTRLTKLLVSANVEYKKISGKHSAQLIDILKIIGDPKKLMASVEGGNSDMFKELSRPAHSEELRNVRKPQQKDRVQADIESAKIKREQLKAKLLLQEQQKQMAEEKKMRTFKRQFELKIIPANTPILSPTVFDLQKPVFFYDLKEESFEDQEGVYAIMRKYTRVLKLLYQKYSSTGYRKKENTTFEKQIEKLTLMTEAEMYKLLKDQGVAPRLMSKEVFSSVFKGCCVRVQRTDLTSVDFDGYYDLIFQVAMYVFSKPPKDLSAYPPAVSVKAFFDLLRSASGEHGLSIKFFDEPDPGAGDRDLVRKLNQTLQQNPNSEVPDGYKKVTESELQVSYGIPRAVRIPRSYKMALGVLDELLNSALGIHILEPQFWFKAVVRAQGVLQKQNVKPAIPVNFPPEIKYQVSLLVKTRPREVVMECAEVLDDLIYSVEMWSPVLLSKGRHGHGRLGAQQLNPILRSKDMQAKELKQQREQAERKRQLRRQIVEETLQAAKQKQAKRDKRNHRKQRKAEKIQVLELQKREEERRKIREGKEKELRDWHQQKKEVEQHKLMEESLQKQREEGEKAKFRKEFLVKERKRLIELSKEQIVKKRQSQEEESVAVQRLEETKLAQRHKAAQTIIQHRKERDLERAAKQRISAAGNQPEVVQTLTEFNGTVEVLFTHYSKAAARLDLDPLLAVKALPLPGFKKFCSQFEIVPNLVGSEEAVQVFTRLSREEREVEGVLALSQDGFKQALVQLAILGKSAMQRINGEVSNASEAFGAKGITDFFSFLMVTQDPKATLVLLKKINEPVLTLGRHSKSVMKGK